MVALLLPHAELGGHGDHQLIPVRQQADAVDGCFCQGPALSFLLDCGIDQLLSWTMRLLLEWAEVHGVTQGRDIPGEADVRKMTATVARLQPNDAAVVGDAAPDVRVTGSVAKKTEFPVLQT